MEITSINAQKNELTIKVSSNEESLFMLLKGYLEDNNDVDIVGVTKEHHLIDSTEFYIRTLDGKDAKAVFTKALETIKKELQQLKLK